MKRLLGLLLVMGIVGCGGGGNGGNTAGPNVIAKDQSVTESVAERETSPGADANAAIPANGRAYIKKYDTDGDGTVSKEEFKAHPETSEQMKSRIDSFWSFMAGDDGVIDEKEADDMLKRSQNRGRGGVRPSSEVASADTSDSRRSGRGWIRLKENDSDGDGKISKDEAPERIKRFFERMDKNKNGFIEESEVGGSGGSSRGGGERTVKGDSDGVGRPATSAVQATRQSAWRTQSANNLKQIALAFHNYHDSYNCFPTTVMLGPDGKTPHSWRVAILPFLEADPLYKEYRLDEPWDSDHNKRLLSRMPNTYRHPSDPADSTVSSYYGLSGKTGVFTKQGLTFRQITDGTSNTVLVVEARRPIPWTKPQDIPFVPETLPQLGGYSDWGFQAAFCDSSVRFIANSVDGETLRRYFQFNDRQSIPPGRRGGRGWIRLKENDSDGDGKISKDEAPENIKRFFDRMDKNKNGFIEESEVGGTPLATAEVLKRLQSSRNGGVQTSVQFVNQTDEPLRLFWIDTGGLRRAYGVIEAGGKRDQPTYAGHIWLLVNPEGRPRGLFSAVDGAATAVIDGTLDPVIE